MLRMCKIYIWYRECCGFGQCILCGQSYYQDIIKSFPCRSSKKRRYWSNVFPGDLIYTPFQYKEVSDVDIIEAITQEYKTFQIFCMKDPDYVMRIMEDWITLDELEGTKPGRDFTDISDMNKKNYLPTNSHLVYTLSI